MAILAPSEDHEHHRKKHHQHNGEDNEIESLTSDPEKLRDENDVIPLKDPKSRHRGGHKGKEDKDKPNDEVLEPAQEIRRPMIGNSTEEELPLEGKEEIINIGTSEVSSDTVSEDPVVKPDLLSQPRRGGPHRDGEHGEHGENEHGEHGGDDDDHHGKKEKGHKKHGGHDKDD